MIFTGSDLRSLRRGHRLPVTRMARLFGVSRSTWTKYELMENQDLPRIWRFALAAWSLGIPPMGEMSVTRPADMRPVPREAPKNRSGLISFFRKKR